MGIPYTDSYFSNQRTYTITMIDPLLHARHERYILGQELDKLMRKMSAGDNLTYEELHREANLRVYISQLDERLKPRKIGFMEKLRKVFSQ